LIFNLLFLLLETLKINFYLLLKTFTMESLIYVLIATGLSCLLFSFWKTTWIEKQEVGTDTMKNISKQIAGGAKTFLKTELKFVAVLVGSIAILLFFEGKSVSSSNGFVAVSFILGAALSFLSGYLGMRTAVDANVRTTNAARSSVNSALRIAFDGGSVMGLGVISLGILGLSGLFLMYQSMEFQGGVPETLNIISGFLLGTATVSLVTRVSGGIFSKAADISVDSASNNATGIPNNRPFNPAKIADNLGDNLSTVKGTGIDIFDSFTASMTAAMILGSTFLASDEFTVGFKLGPVLLPLVLGGASILITSLSTFFINIKEGLNPRKAFNRVELAGVITTAIAAFFIITFILPNQWILVSETETQTIQTTYTSLGVFWAVLTGLVAGVVICSLAEISTGIGSKTVKSLIAKSLNGTAAGITGGLEAGMRTAIFPVLVISVSILVSYQVAGVYGIAMAAVGFLSSAGIRSTIDAYGAIAENSGDIARMSELPAEVGLNTNKLENIGNNAFAVGKGFTIAAGILSATALLSAFFKISNIQSADVTNPIVIAAIIFGAMLPLLFSAAIIDGVSRTTNKITNEVKRQFTTISELITAAAIIKKYNNDLTNATDQEKSDIESASDKSDNETCTKVAGCASMKESIYPILAAIIFPTSAGFIGGADILGAMLIGSVASGFLIAFFSTNSGYAWSNARKTVENNIVIDTVTYGKGSDLYQATVTGDAVGDPLKDASGSAIASFLKFMVVVALVLSPSLAFVPKNKMQNEINSKKNAQKAIILKKANAVDKSYKSLNFSETV
jgi:K(+)-stimulated pyrophosphate-energized sodium pump